MVDAKLNMGKVSCYDANVRALYDVKGEGGILNMAICST